MQRNPDANQISGWTVLSTPPPLPWQHLQRLHGDVKSGCRSLQKRLKQLKIVVQIWNATAAGWCVEHIRQQKGHIHADRAANISVEGIQRWFFYLGWYCYDQPVSLCCLKCSRNTPNRWSPFEVYQICQRIQLAWKFYYNQLVPVVMWPQYQSIDGRQRSVRRLQQ